jgi:hypothetical protein
MKERLLVLGDSLAAVIHESEKEVDAKRLALATAEGLLVVIRLLAEKEKS